MLVDSTCIRGGGENYTREVNARHRKFTRSSWVTVYMDPHRSTRPHLLATLLDTRWNYWEPVESSQSVFISQRPSADLGRSQGLWRFLLHFYSLQPVGPFSLNFIKALDPQHNCIYVLWHSIYSEPQGVVINTSVCLHAFSVCRVWFVD